MGMGAQTKTVDERKEGTLLNRETNSNTVNKVKTTRKVPKTAAITITGVGENFSYAQALRKAREKINLKNLDIQATKVRRAITGGLLIEIAVEDGNQKADVLATELREVLKEKAIVARLSRKGEVTIYGLDNSIIAEEVRGVLAEIGDCSVDEVRVGPIRPTRSGLGFVWAQLPLAAAVKATDTGKIRIGWTVARIQLLETRPIQCYKCWQYEHVRNMCRSEMDRSGVCYRCGETGHQVRMCREVPACILCKEKGLPSNHWMGGAAYKANATTEGVQPGRRPVNVNAKDD